MTEARPAWQAKTLSPARALLFGTLTVGTLDILDALIFFGARGVAPMRIFHSIAAGLLGAASYEGGLPTAVLGGFLHYFIAFLIVTIFYVISRKWHSLTRRPLLYGVLYGVVAYVVMSFVVVPLSARGGGIHLPPLIVLCNGLLIHMVGVGLPSAFFARAARR